MTDITTGAARQSRTRARATSHGTKLRPSGQDVCDWIEGKGQFDKDPSQPRCYALRVPEGKLVGKPVDLAAFQRRFICEVYDNPYGTRRAFLSFGRKNGKTALAGFLLLNHLCGPSSRQNSQLFSTAQSREQAAILFQLAAKVVRMSPDLRSVITIRSAVG